MTRLRQLLRDNRGTSTVEYGLVLGFIVIVIFGAIAGLGGETTRSFNSTATKVSAATKSSVS